MICKWNEANNITFEVHSVRKTYVKENLTTKFFINDFIKNLKDSKKKYWCTVFADIDLEDGDRIKILDLDRLVTSQDPKSKKIMQFIELVPEVIKKEDYTPKVTETENPYE